MNKSEEEIVAKYLARTYVYMELKGVVDIGANGLEIGALNLRVLADFNRDTQGRMRDREEKRRLTNKGEAHLQHLIKADPTNALFGPGSNHHDFT